MNIKTIIELVENHTLEELILAEEALIDENTPQIQVSGIDEGEQLTHIMGAVWCKQEIAKSKCDTRSAVRLYTQKVRNSIS